MYYGNDCDWEDFEYKISFGNFPLKTPFPRFPFDPIIIPGSSITEAMIPPRSSPLNRLVHSVPVTKPHSRKLYKASTSIARQLRRSFNRYHCHLPSLPPTFRPRMSGHMAVTSVHRTRHHPPRPLTRTDDDGPLFLTRSVICSTSSTIIRMEFSKKEEYDITFFSSSPSFPSLAAQLLTTAASFSPAVPFSTTAHQREFGTR